MPEQFVESPEFGIALALNDPAMFVERDRPLVLIAHDGPLQLRQYRPRQPVHLDGEVVGAAQEDIGSHPASLQHVEEMV